ncbi:MAG: hypothetical protein E7225_01845 [Clostridiales bacterium]|nr:hypothetical protein [Clostridiales bacterium]
MKKRIFVLSLILIMLLSTSMICAAEHEEVEPLYIGTTSAIINLNISNGDATMTANLIPVSDSVFDRVNITIELYKGNTSVYKGSFNTYYDDIAGKFKKTVTEELDSKGSYYAKATFKCYKSGTLIETINKSSGYVVY